MRDEDREYQKQLEEEEKQRAIEEDESKFTIGDIFDPGNFFSQGISYDDMSPTDIALTASMLVPGLGLAGMGARGALAAARGLSSGTKAAGGLGSLGSKMMDNLKNYISRPTGSSPMGPMGIFPGMNQGGRVGLGLGGDPMDMADIIKLLELDMSLGGGPNIGSAAGSGDAMRDAGFKTIMEMLSE